MSENRSWSTEGLIRADEKSETLIFPLSSEEPYRRWDGVEILDHGEGAVDLSWLNSGNAPLLDNHDRYTGLRSQIGRIQRAWLEDKRIYVEVQFSNRDDVKGIRQDVLEGVVRNVSVGYERSEILKNEVDDTYRVMKWKPIEASFVAVPADMTVGVGRNSEQPSLQETQMSKETMTVPSGNEGNNPAARAADATLPGLPVTPVAATPTAAERSDELATAMGEIIAMATTHNKRDLADEFIGAEIRAGRVPSIAAFQGKLRQALPADTPIRNIDIGLNERERKSFSLVKLARVIADGLDTGAARTATFELEACAAAAQKVNARNGGLVMPMDLLNTWSDATDDYGNRSSDLPLSRAAMATSGNPNVQSVDHLGTRFIDNLRNASSILSMGVTVLAGLDGNIEIPGGDANIAAAWLGAEDANAAESVPTFRKVSMAIKDVAAYTDMTRRMLMQSTIDVEMYVRRQLVRSMVEAIDLAGLQGSGAAGVPRGLKNTAGIGSVVFAAVNPTWGEIVDLETDVADANALFGNTGYLGTTNMRGYFKKTPKVSGQAVFIMDSNNDGLNGHRYVASNQVTAGDLYFGNWADMLMGLWGSLELGRSTEAKFLSGGVRLRAIQSVDFGVARVGSFSLGNDGI